MALGTVISGVLMMFGIADTDIEVVSGAILILGGAVTYTIAEGKIDAERIKQTIGSIVDVVETFSDDK